MASKDNVTNNYRDLTDKEVQRGADTLEDFVNYVSNPWRVMWTNFVAGVFRGLGAVVGASVVIALLVWTLSLFVSTPLVGQYFENMRDSVNNYVEQNNYNDEFDRLGDSLERLEKSFSDKGFS
ncbi:MAG: DUF5665 domain-containing protein [Thiolinea sp.]